MAAAGKKPVSRTKRIGLPHDRPPVTIARAGTAVATAMDIDNIVGPAFKVPIAGSHVRVNALLLDFHVRGPDGATYRPWLNVVGSGTTGKAIGFTLSPKPASLAEIAAIVAGDGADATGPVATRAKAPSLRRRAGSGLPHGAAVSGRSGTAPSAPPA